MKNLHIASSLLQGPQVLAVPFAVAALFLWHFVAFLTLVLNCLKELHDWQLLGNMNWVLDSPICSDTNPLCSCFMVGTSLLTCVSFSSLCLQTWEHRRVVCKLKSRSLQNLRHFLHKVLWDLQGWKTLHNDEVLFSKLSSPIFSG